MVFELNQGRLLAKQPWFRITQLHDILSGLRLKTCMGIMCHVLGFGRRTTDVARVSECKRRASWQRRNTCAGAHQTCHRRYATCVRIQKPCHRRRATYVGMQKMCHSSICSRRRRTVIGLAQRACACLTFAFSLRFSADT